MAAPRTPQEHYERLKGTVPELFRMALEGVDHCSRHPDKKTLVYFNLRAAAEAALRMGMALVRNGGDLRGGMEWFREGARLAEQVLDFAKQPIEATPWSGHHILYCNLLVGDFETAQAIARWIVSLKGFDPSLGETGDPFALAASWFVLDERTGLERVRTAYIGADGSGVHPYWQAMLVYIDLYEAVLARDQAAFDKLMEAREKVVLARRRQTDTGRLEYGGGIISELVLDFMGIGIAKVAVSRDLALNQDTVNVPKSLVLAS
jgi:hypothetical protein